MDIDDVNMKEIEDGQTIQKKYYTLETKVKVLDYIDDKKQNIRIFLAQILSRYYL